MHSGIRLDLPERLVKLHARVGVDGVASLLEAIDRDDRNRAVLLVANIHARLPPFEQIPLGPTPNR